MHRPLVENAFIALTHQERCSFGGNLDESSLTLGGPQTIGQFMVDVAAHLEERFSRLPDTPPAKGCEESARERLIGASDMLRSEGQALLKMERSSDDREQWWLAHCMFVSAPWVRMTAALLDEAESKSRTEASGISGVDRGKR